MVNKQTKTATTFAISVAVGSATLQCASSLQPRKNFHKVMRMGIAKKTAGSIWRKLPSTKIDRDSKISFTGLLDSPFDNYDIELDPITAKCADGKMNVCASSLEPSSSSPTSTTSNGSSSEDNIDTIYNPSNATRPSAVVSDYGDNNLSEEMYFDVPSIVLEGDTNSDEDRGKILAVPTDKLMRFFKEESPPVSVLLLNFVAIIWGSQHAIIKSVVEDSDPAAFTFLRFTLASLIASPYLPGVKQTILVKLSSTPDEDDGRKKDEVDLWKPWRWGIEMGLWMFLGFSLQAIGLQTTTAQRSGFLLYLNVKFVPFFAKILLERQISILTWVSAFAAFFGTALLALDGQSLGLNIGDVWSVMAAASSAMFILRLEKASFEVPQSSELNATSLAVVAILSGMWLLLGNNDQQIASEVMETAFAHPLELLYLGGVSTALANYIQAKAQKDIPAERASIIYSLDPVYGAFFFIYNTGRNAWRSISVHRGFHNLRGCCFELFDAILKRHGYE